MDAIEAFLECRLTAADALAALPLSIEAGWNQTADDWRFMLAHGQGLGMRDSLDRLIASALTLPLGEQLSWISMVLVAADRRRSGLGTRLLHRCVEAILSSGATAGLDATEFGRPVYARLGFRDLYPISRWRLVPSTRTAAADPIVRMAVPDDLSAVLAYDAGRSAMRRAPVLRYLFEQGRHLAVVAERNGSFAGYALGRAGSIATQIGPIVADDPQTAHALLAAAAAGSPVIVDIPDAQALLTRNLCSGDAVRMRGFVRMALGDPPAGLGRADSVFAIAGPELG